MFQRRHYEFIARVLREAAQDYDMSGAPHRFAKEFERANPLFDKDRFLKACTPYRDR